MSQLPSHVVDQLRAGNGQKTSRSPFPSPASWSPYFDTVETVLSNPAIGDFYAVAPNDYRRVLLVVYVDLQDCSLYFNNHKTGAKGIPPDYNSSNGTGWFLEFSRWGPLVGGQWGLDPFEAWTSGTALQVFTRS